GSGEQHRQITFDRFKSVVSFALDSQSIPVLSDLDRGSAGHLRQIKKLGQLGPYLTGLGIDTVLAAENNVVLFVTERKRQRASRCKRVRTRELAPHKMNRAIGSCPEAFNERFARLRRTHRDDDNLPAAKIAEPDGFSERAAVKGIHDVRHAFPDDCVCLWIEPDLGDFGDLFYADDASHLL